MNINCIKEKEFHYETFNHAKRRLRYHFIFSTKYRRKCLNEIRDVVLESFRYAESISHFKIITMEIDKDHIHILVKFPPKYSIEQIVRRMKQISSNYIYNKVPQYMRHYYWSGKHIIWTHGYFCSTIGEVSEENLKHYIENQG